LRSLNWGGFFVRNLALVAFLFFALMSIFWSDFPFVAMKRWFRDFGDYLVILVVISDRRPLEAIGTIFRRLSYLLISLSILLFKYYPQLGRQYTIWEGAPMYVGATTSKNMLGVVCLISGLFFFWDTLTRWPLRKDRRIRRIIFVNVAFMVMTLWVLNLANSATSRVCLVLGCLVIAAGHLKAMKRHPAFLKVLIPMCFCLYVLLEYGFGINAQVAEAVGRNSTLTGRTDLWKFLLNMHTNPLFGTGYDSFWLGPRLEVIWRSFYLFNEAHNGYLDVYLNLGLIGLSLLVVYLIASYQRICRRLATGSSLALLSLALWTVLLFYNVTEAAFRGSQLMWLTFLMGAIVTPERAKDRVHDVAAFEYAGGVKSFQRLPLESPSLRR
jgi:exopolysaccharide production protein ExoQ